MTPIFPGSLKDQPFTLSLSFDKLKMIEIQTLRQACSEPAEVGKLESDPDFCEVATVRPELVEGPVLSLPPMSDYLSPPKIVDSPHRSDTP